MADGSVVIDIEGNDDDLNDKLKNVAGTAAKTLAAGVASSAAVASAALVKLGQQALNARGELEQNLGGAATVFGEYATQMEETAQNAFSNLGLSTSDYLANANKMGSLLQGIGYDTEDAMKTTTEVMQRASDVASIMGIDVSSAIEAVTGAAKANFTMMDNLGVAINDTNLAEYALEQGITKSTSAMTTQEKVALAMQMFLEKTAYAAGNYAKENDTLVGSITTVQAAWENFLTGTADAKTLAEAIGNTATIMADQIIDMAPELIEGMGELVESLSPELPGLIKQLAPALMDGVSELVDVAVEALPSLIDTIIPLVAQYAPQIAASLVNGIIGALPTLLDSLVGAVGDLAVGVFDAVTDSTADMAVEARDLVSALDDFREITRSVNEELAETESQINATANIATRLADNLSDLEIGGVDDSEVQEYANTVAQINELIPELNLSIDDETGMVTQTNAAIKEQINLWKQNAIEQAQQKAMQETYDKWAEAATEVALAEEKLAEAQRESTTQQGIINAGVERQKEIMAELEELYKGQDLSNDQITKINTLNKEYSDLEGKVSSARDAQIAADQSVADYQNSLAAAEETQSEFAAEIDTATAAFAGYSEGAETASTSTSSLTAQQELVIEKTNAIAEATSTATTSVKESVEGMYEPWETAAQVVTTSLDTMMQSLQGQIEYWNSYEADMQTLLNSNIEGIDELVQAYSDGSESSVNMIASLVAAYGEGTPEAVAKIQEFIAALGEVETAQDTVAETAGRAAGSVVESYYNGLMAGDATVEEAGHHLLDQAVMGLKPDEDQGTSEGTELATNYAGGVTDESENVATAGETIKDAAIDGLQDKDNQSTNTGEQLIAGYMTGLDNKAGALYDRVSTIITNAIAAGDQAALIASPSRKTKESGQFLIEGYIEGMNDCEDDLDDTLELVTEKVLETFPKDSDGYNAAKEFMEGFTEAVEDYADDIRDSIDDITDDIDDMTEKLRDYGELSETTTVDALNKQIEAMQKYSDTIHQMQNRGASESLMSEVTSMGVDDAVEFSEALLDLSDESWSEYMAAWEQKQALAAEISQSVYQTQLDAQRELLANVATDAAAALGDSGEDTGAKFIDGIIAGMKSRQSDLEAAASDMVNIISKAAQAAGEIHSPSKLMYRKVGEPLAQGVAAGFEHEMTNVSGRLQRAVSSEIGSISARASAGIGSESAREIITNNNTVREKVVRVEGDGITDDLVRLLNLRLKAEDRRTGTALVTG